MCGIVGIYLKTKKFEKNLGKMLSGMLNNMESRGPDSAGFAIYKNEGNNINKFSLCINDLNFNVFKKELSKKIKKIKLNQISDHVILKTKEKPKKVLEILDTNFPEVSIVGYGKSIEIFKQVGNPKDVVKKFKLGDFPVAENYYNQTISIPLFPSMTSSQIEKVIKDINDFIKLKC